MGLFVPYAKFLRASSQRTGPFGRTLTVGRLTNFVVLKHAQQLQGLRPDDAAAVASDIHASTFLRSACGASHVEAIDYSDYEGADRIGT